MCTKDPVDMLLNLSALRGQLNKLCHALQCETDEIDEQWVALGMVGGQREDHAAALLGKLDLHLGGIAEFCKNVQAHIKAVQADPFQRND